MDTNDGKNHLYARVDDFEVAMLVTQTTNAMHARPMAIASLDEALGVYLVTVLDSIKVDEIRASPQALLTFQSVRKFASVRGELTVLHDRPLVERMWKESWKVWFPEGKSDPNIGVLKFTALEGEYWDNGGMRGLKYVYDAALAYVAGGTLKTDDDQHAKVSL